MITEFRVSRSTFSFKTAIVGLINLHPKMGNSSLSFSYFFKKNMKVVKEICKENASELNKQ